MKPTDYPLPQSLYIQYMPDQQTRSALADIQMHAARIGHSGRMVKPEKMHLTVLHFGDLQETFLQLRLLQPDLTAAMYREAVARFIDDCRPFLTDTVAVVPNKLQLYGPYHSVLALSMQPDSRTTEVHALVLEKLYQFLHTCGISSSVSIPYRPRALQFSTVFSPHISLIKNCSGSGVRIEDIPLDTSEYRLYLYPLGT